jgi:MFS family permease
MTGILATGIVGVVNFVFTFPAVLFVDNWGRRPTLFLGSTALAICLAIIAAIVAQFGDNWTANQTAGNAAVAFLYIYIAIFAVTWGPLAWVVSTEVFPLSLRAKGMGFSSAVNWLMNFVVATITPIALQNIGYGTYLLFMAFMILGALWAFFLLPELKNRTLEEVSRVVTVVCVCLVFV